MDQWYAGGYEAANQALGELPDFLVKTASSPAYEYLKRIREENPVTTTAGGLAGNIGSAFIPFMGPLKVLKGLKAGGKALELGLQGAAMAGKQAIPRALAETGMDTTSGSLQTGNLALDPSKIPSSLTQHAGEAALGMGAGVLLNPAISKIGEGASKLAQIAKPWLNKRAVIAKNLGLNVTNDDITKKLTELSQTRAGTDRYVQENRKAFEDGLAKYTQDQNINTAGGIEKYLAKEKPLLQEIENQWNANPPSNNKMLSDLLKNQKMKELLDSGTITREDLANIGSSLVQKGANGGLVMKDYWDVEGQLKNSLKDAYTKLQNQRVGDNPEPLRNSISILSAMKEVFNNTARNMPGVSAEARDILSNWKYRDVLVDAADRTALMAGPSNTLGEGSFSQFGNAALGRTLLGGAGLGAGSMFPSEGNVAGIPASSIGAGLTGVLGASLFPRALPTAIRNASALLGKIAMPATEAMAPKTGQMATAALASKAAGITPTQISQPPPVTPPAQVSQPPPVTPPAQVSGLPSGVVASQAPVKMGSETLKMNVPPKVNMDSSFGQRLMGNLEQMYDTYRPTFDGTKTPMSRQDVFDYFAKLTGGFEPTNSSTIKLVTNNPQEQQMLQTAMPTLNQLKKIDLNKVVDIGAGLTPDFIDPSIKEAKSYVVNLIAKLANPSGTISSRESDVATKMVDNIRDLRIPNEEKKQKLFDLLVSKGFPMDKLRDLGLTEGLY
jgi:hypothetical protein